MRKSIDEVSEITKELRDRYLSDKNYSLYIENIITSHYKRNDKNSVIGVVDEYCIRFYLKDKLPSSLPIPHDYKDVRIFIEIKN